MRLRRSFIILFVWGIATGNAFAQTTNLDADKAKGKPAIDFAAIDSWLWIPSARVSISDDGRYWSYLIASPRGDNAKVIVQATSGEIQYELSGKQPGIFSGDSKWYIYQTKDSLLFLPLGIKKLRKAVAVAGYQTNQKLKTDKVNWIAYQLKDTTRTLVLHHFPSGREERIEGVSNYSFDGNGRWLVCRKVDGSLLLHSLAGSASRQVQSVSHYLLDKNGKILVYIDKQATDPRVMRMNLADGKTTTLWESHDPAITAGSLAVDETGRQVLFIVKEKKGTAERSSIWYHSSGMVRADQRLSDGNGRY
ncbi:MAG: hypothetical protein QM594_00570 [Niabella sp.]